MGDRANVVVADQWLEPHKDDRYVFLYGHWSGHELPETVRKALDSPEGRGRWQDSSYLARIVFDYMTGRTGGETGFGIATRPPDNEYDFILLDKGTLYRVPEAQYKASGFKEKDKCHSISFEDYVAAPERSWENLTDVLQPA